MSAMVMLFQVSETKRNKSSKYHHRTDPTAAVDQAESFDVLHALHHALGRVVDVHREVAENVDVDEGDGVVADVIVHHERRLDHPCAEGEDDQPRGDAAAGCHDEAHPHEFRDLGTLASAICSADLFSEAGPEHLELREP